VGGIFIQKLTRSINMGFRVTAEEQARIMKRMEEIGFPSIRSYLLKMALNGRIIHLDLTEVRECSRLLSNISNNINQIAKRVNETGNAYAADMEDIKARLNEVWQQQDKTNRVLAKLLEVM